MNNFLAFFELLFNGVVPVAFISFFGFYLGKKKIFYQEDANTILKFVGMIAVPAMSADIMLKINFTKIDLSLYLFYFSSEILVYLIGFVIAKLLFRVTLKEAILIGAASAFANHVLYVYPIALLEFSFEKINPLVTIMAMDVVLLSITIFLLDLVSTKDISVVQLLKKQAFNPPLIGLLIGLTIIIFPFDFPKGIYRTFEFISTAAAPCALFALGILLTTKIGGSHLKLAFVISFLRLIIHPIIALIFIISFGNYEVEVARTTLMVAAAPVGLMALTFAPKYKVKTGAIATSILWTLVGSLILLPLVGIIHI